MIETRQASKPERAVLSVLASAALLTAVSWMRVTHLPVGYQGAFPPPLLYLLLQMMAVPRAAWVLVGALLLVVWSPQLFLGSPRIPHRSIIGLGILTALTVWHAWASWEYSISYRGWLATSAIVGASSVPLLALWSVYACQRRTQTFLGSLVFHVGVLMWITMVAFPDIIELP
jgi:hypothetical protein